MVHSFSRSLWALLAVFMAVKLSACSEDNAGITGLADSLSSAEGRDWSPQYAVFEADDPRSEGPDTVWYIPQPDGRPPAEGFRHRFFSDGTLELYSTLDSSLAITHTFELIDNRQVSLLSDSSDAVYDYWEVLAISESSLRVALIREPVPQLYTRYEVIYRR